MLDEVVFKLGLDMDSLRINGFRSKRLVPLRPTVASRVPVVWR